MGDLFEAFRRHVTAGDLLPDTGRILAAVSGGGDSVALLKLLVGVAGERGIAIEAAYVDHRTRPETESEAAFVRDLARGAGLAFRLLRLPQRPRTASEGVLRRERRAQLIAYARECGAVAIALGHQADDVAETVVMRVLRGAGVDGMTGIPARSGPFVRPLLPFRRAALRAYLLEGGERWMEDRTNAEPTRLRNFVRNALLPALRRSCPSIDEGLVGLADAMRRLAVSLDRWDDDWLERHAAPFGAGVIFGVERFAAEPDASRGRLVRAAAARSGCRRSAVGERAARAAAALGAPGSSPGAAVPVAGGLAAMRLGGSVYVGPRIDPLPAVETPLAHGHNACGPLGIQVHVEEEGADCVLRNRRPGDRLAGRSRSIKRMLIEAGIPRVLRSHVPLAARGSEVLWVAGVRAGLPWEGLLKTVRHEGPYAEWLSARGPVVVARRQLC